MAAFPESAQLMLKNGFRERCTLMVDASWCPNTNAGGFGAWCASDRGKKDFGGAFVDLLPSAQDAEVIAVCNALWMSMNENLIVEGMDVLIQIDCLNAIKIYKKMHAPQTANERKAVAWLEDFKSKYNITVAFRHVKGHVSGSLEARHISNNMCDETAKFYMRRKRSTIRLEQLKQSLIEPAKRNYNKSSKEKRIAKKKQEIERLERELQQKSEYGYDSVYGV